jgi:hypothetical protein
MIFGGFRIRMPKRFRAARVTEPVGADIPPHTPALPPQLEARITAFEPAASAADFDAASWFWMLLLGLATTAAATWCYLVGESVGGYLGFIKGGLALSAGRVVTIPASAI